MGQTGPASQLAGYGYHAGAIAGFYEVTGWQDVGPSGPWVAYTDAIAPRSFLLSARSAIDHRRRTRGTAVILMWLRLKLHCIFWDLN